MITIIDYGLGNLASIRNMLKKAGIESQLCDSPEQIQAATKFILPGVGAFDRGVAQLHERKLWDALNQKVLGERTPILGICLGMQLMTHGSEEGQLPGFGWIDAYTRRFQIKDNDRYKVPHMGWNHVNLKKESELINELSENTTRFYFVHSYRVVLNDPECELMSTEFEGPFTSAFQRGNVYGTQFHPEKSHRFGLQLLRNFACIGQESNTQ